VEEVGAAVTIVLLRSLDVSLQTVRTVFAVEGRRNLAAVLGFLEATTFILAAGIVFSGPLSPLRVVAFGAGFSLGTVAGLSVVRALKLGTVTVRIFSTLGPIGVAEALRQAGYVVTTFDGQGHAGPVRLILAVVRKRQLEHFLGVVRPFLRDCFVTVGEHPLSHAPHPLARSA
jgi:uncharacterized protein YebE (UPF0316 family)